LAGVDFSNRKSAEAWFEEQSIETCCALSSRAALRVCANISAIKGDAGNTLALAVLRALLISAGRGLGPPADISWRKFAHSAARSAAFSAARSAAQSAIRSAFSAAFAAARYSNDPDSATFAAQSTVHSALSADSALSAFSAIFWDAEQPHEALRSKPVWAGADVPPAIAETHQSFLAFLRADPAWAFWLQFYEGIWTGTFTNWPLAMEVIQIDHDEWEHEDGHKHIAGLIAGIEARLVIEDLPQVEEVFATDSGLYDVRSTATDPVVLIDSIASRVRFAFDLAVSSNSCDLDELSTAATLLRHALDNCLGDPNGFEQWLRQASSLITDGLARGEFSHHATLDVLVATLNEIGLQLRADHPDVAAAAMSRTNRAVQELSDKRRLEGAQLIEDLRDEGTTGRLQTELGLSARVARDGSSALATADAFKQAGNRAGKVSLAERIKLAESSSPMAGLKITMRAESLVRYVLDLISGGGV